MKEEQVIILGAGLTGLTLAYLLKQNGVDALVIEARDRLGGRIHTDTNGKNTPIELGATWIGKKHVRICGLLDSLGIPLFEQRLGRTAFYEPISTSPPQLVQLPPNDEPSYRISGGSAYLIETLSDHLDNGQVRLGEMVEAITHLDQVVQVKTDKGMYVAAKVVSTLPPNLMVSSLRFQPALPQEIHELARATHTWMGESIKVGLRFDRPFWREGQCSGTIFSNVGPIPEMYDHANVADTKFALKGFLNGVYSSVSREHRLNLVMNQLKKYYGHEVEGYKSYEEAVWSKEAFTFAPYETPVLPHQNNGHQLYGESYYNERFFIAGSETSPSFPGYMEGAVQSAFNVMKRLI